MSALLTRAAVHDSQTAIRLPRMRQSRVTTCYDLMDAAYCSEEIRNHSRSLGHVPLIDHHPRGGDKIAIDPAQRQRYRELARPNARMRG